MAATKEGGSDPLQSKTIVLKVSIHCEGCKKKVKKILRNVAGVSTCDIDSKQNKVTVTGDVEAEALIRKLLKSGKHSELWPSENKPSNPNPNPNPNSNSSKGKNKEKDKDNKDASKSNEPNETPEKSAASTNPETVTKPAETQALEQKRQPAESSAPKENDAGKAKPKPGKQKEPETDIKSDETETETETETATKSVGSSKNKGKKVVESASSNEEPVMNSGGQQLIYRSPAYPQPIYSYNTVHPTVSHSYYATPAGPPPQSYMYSGPPPPSQMYRGLHSGLPLPEHYPQERYYPHESYPQERYYPHESYPQERYYPHDGYYGSMEPSFSSTSSQSQGNYDYFSDENANSCHVM